MPVTSPRNRPTGPGTRRGVAVLTFLAALVVVLAVGVGTASAHATLETTIPADGQSVPSGQVGVVTATFSENVTRRRRRPVRPQPRR